MFCQHCLPWPIRFGWPYTAWLIVSLSKTRLWSMWSVWLVFCDYGFHSVCPLMDKDERLMEASCWERLRGKLGLVLISSVQFSHSVMSSSFVTPWTAAHQASLFITNSPSLLKLMSIESVMSSNHLILFHPLLLLPSIFPSIRVFSNESVLHQVAKVLMGRAMFSKSLIQFSVDGWGCVPSFCLTWGQTMVEVMKIRVLQRCYACTAVLRAPDPAAGHRQPMPPPETPGHPQTSLGQSLVGSLLLSPGFWCTQGSVCALQESVSPVLCKFWRFYGGVSGWPPPRGLMQYPGLLHPEPLPLWQAIADSYLRRRHSDTVLAQSLWGGCAFCALSRSDQLRRPGAWWVHCLRWTVHLNHLPFLATWCPGCAAKAPSQACCVSPL